MQGINVESVARVCKPLAGVLTRASSRHAPLAALAPRAADALAVVRWRCGQGSGDGRSVRRLAGQRGELSGGRLRGWRSKGSAARRGSE